MSIKLSLDNGMVKYTETTSKRKFGAILTNLQAQNANIKGKAVVDYGKGLRNEFEFSNADELVQKMEPCLEPILLKELMGGN